MQANVGGAYYDESWAVMSLLMMTGNMLDYTRSSRSLAAHPLRSAGRAANSQFLATAPVCIAFMRGDARADRRR